MTRAEVEEYLVDAERPHLEAAGFSTVTDGENQSLNWPIYCGLREQGLTSTTPSAVPTADVEVADDLRLLSAARIALLDKVLSKYLSEVTKQAEGNRLESYRRADSLRALLPVLRQDHASLYQAAGADGVAGGEILPQTNPTDAVGVAVVGP